MRMFEVFKPAFDDWIKIGYDLLDAIASRSTSL
jgi:hypothetical protein